MLPPTIQPTVRTPSHDARLGREAAVGRESSSLGRCPRCFGNVCLWEDGDYACLLCGEIVPPSRLLRQDQASLQQVEAVLRRAERSPAFIAYAIGKYRERSGVSTAALARWLGLSPARLCELALCRKPDPAAGTFEQDVERLATATGCDADRLAMLLRWADTVWVPRAN